MAMTPAERQARYRERVKARGGETAEAAAERIRQGIYAEVIEDAEADASYREPADVERNVTLLRGLAAVPMWPAGGFAEWLTAVMVRAVEDEIAAAWKAKRAAERKRRPVTLRPTRVG